VAKSKRGRKKKEQIISSGEIQDYQVLLSSALLKVNEGIKTKKISKEIILSYALSKLTESDLQKIQRENIANEDKVNIKYEEFKKKEGNEDISFYDFLALQLRLHH